MNPIIGYPGGKTKLKKEIIKYIPPHKVYVEPFVGGGSVFFAKEPAEKEVINDIDKDLVRFYRYFKRRDVSVKRCDMRPSRERFNRYKTQKPKTPQQYVCSYLYRNKWSYAKAGKSFLDKAQVCGGNSRNAGIKSITPEHKKRFSGVKIENKDFKQVVKENDSKNTFIYMDPPYPDTYDYGKPAVDPDEVCKLAAKAKGKVLISYNDHPAVRKAAKKYGLKIKRIRTRYTMGSDMSDGGRVVTELLISNYDMDKVKKEKEKTATKKNNQKQASTKKRIIRNKGRKSSFTHAFPSLSYLLGIKQATTTKKKRQKTSKTSSKSKKVKRKAQSKKKK